MITNTCIVLRCLQNVLTNTTSFNPRNPTGREVFVPFYTQRLTEATGDTQRATIKVQRGKRFGKGVQRGQCLLYTPSPEPLIDVLVVRGHLPFSPRCERFEDRGGTGAGLSSPLYSQHLSAYLTLIRNDFISTVSHNSISQRTLGNESINLC